MGRVADCGVGAFATEIWLHAVSWQTSGIPNRVEYRKRVATNMLLDIRLCPAGQQTVRTIPKSVSTFIGQHVPEVPLVIYCPSDAAA